MVANFCRSLIKVNIFTDQVRPALGSVEIVCSFGCDHAQKNSKIPFQPDTQMLSALLPYTDLVPPSTDPVPPSTNHYSPILTQYHHVSTGNVALGLETSAQFTPALVFGEITDPPPRDSTILLLLMLVSVSCGMELSKQTSTLLLAPG